MEEADGWSVGGLIKDDFLLSSSDLGADDAPLRPLSVHTSASAAAVGAGAPPVVARPLSMMSMMTMTTAAAGGGPPSVSPVLPLMSGAGGKVSPLGGEDASLLLSDAFNATHYHSHHSHHRTSGQHGLSADYFGSEGISPCSSLGHYSPDATASSTASSSSHQDGSRPPSEGLLPSHHHHHHHNPHHQAQTSAYHLQHQVDGAKPTAATTTTMMIGVAGFESRLSLNVSEDYGGASVAGGSSTLLFSPAMRNFSGHANGLEQMMMFDAGLSPPLLAGAQPCLAPSSTPSPNFSTTPSFLTPLHFATDAFFPTTSALGGALAHPHHQHPHHHQHQANSDFGYFHGYANGANDNHHTANANRYAGKLYDDGTPVKCEIDTGEESQEPSTFTELTQQNLQTIHHNPHKRRKSPHGNGRGAKGSKMASPNALNNAVEDAEDDEDGDDIDNENEIINEKYDDVENDDYCRRFYHYDDHSMMATPNPVDQSAPGAPSARGLTTMAAGCGEKEISSVDDDDYYARSSSSADSSMSGAVSRSGSGSVKRDRDAILHDKMLPLPPSKTRSKMHDLAVKHRLITNQNIRGQGVIQLSAEEKRTLLQEGYRLPTRLPLTREEEEALKIVRRKIKNKLSAQESRRKRKEYIDTLEKKVHSFYNDNLHLRSRIKQLEAMNRDLMIQVKKMQQPQQQQQMQQQQ